MHALVQLATTTGATIAGTFGSLAFAVLVGGLTMAWRLGRLEQKVTDLRSDVAEVKDEHRRLQG